jgi:hypothetical protein
MLLGLAGSPVLRRCGHLAGSSEFAVDADVPQILEAGGTLLAGR